MIEIVTQYMIFSPLIVFVVIALDSVPFIGLIVPEELILATVFVLNKDPFLYLLIWISSFSAMMIGQTILFILSKKHGAKVYSYLKIDKGKIKKLNEYIEQANFWDHVLLRISSNSMFRIVAAFLSGTKGIALSKHLLYEGVASATKTTIYLIIGILLTPEEEKLESILFTIGVSIAVVTMVGFAISYKLKTRMKKQNTL